MILAAPSNRVLVLLPRSLRYPLHVFGNDYTAVRRRPLKRCHLIDDIDARLARDRRVVA